MLQKLRQWAMTQRPQRRPLFLKQWRTYRDYTQDKLADIIGCHQTLLSKIERGKAQ
jgi:DNA-binding XRE family transcriptional regulator